MLKDIDVNFTAIYLSGNAVKSSFFQITFG